MTQIILCGNDTGAIFYPAQCRTSGGLWRYQPIMVRLSLSLVQVESARFIASGFFQQISLPFLPVSSLQDDTVRLQTHCFPTNLHPMALARIDHSGLNQLLLGFVQNGDVSNSILPSHLLVGGDLLQRRASLPCRLPSPSLPISVDSGFFFHRLSRD